MRKVAVIGAGNVGAITAYCVAAEDVARVVMVDVVEGLPESRALDFLHAAPVKDYNIGIVGTVDYEQIADADVVVLTAGIARKPGMDRMDLLKTNVGIAKQAAQEIARHAPEAVVIVVTNPLDIMALVVLRETGFPTHRVIGMAGVLDATRFRYFIAQECEVWPGDVEAMVLGGHGDSMVPLTRHASVGGIPLKQLLDATTIERLVARTRKGGAEIVQHLTTSAYYAPGASAAAMALTVVKDEKRLLAASVYLQGEYGYHGIYLGVPIILGSKGVERILNLKLTAEEQRALKYSAETVRKGVETLESVY